MWLADGEHPLHINLVPLRRVVNGGVILVSVSCRLCADSCQADTGADRMEHAERGGDKWIVAVTGSGERDLLNMAGLRT